MTVLWTYESKFSLEWEGNFCAGGNPTILNAKKTKFAHEKLLFPRKDI